MADTSFYKSTQAAEDTFNLLQAAREMLSKGQEQQADQLLEDGKQELLRQFGPKRYAVQISADFIRFHTERGRIDRALPHAVEAISILEKFPERDHIEWGAALARCASLLRALGREEEARAIDARASEAWLDVDVLALEQRVEQLEREVPRLWLKVYASAIPVVILALCCLWALFSFVVK